MLWKRPFRFGADAFSTPSTTEWAEPARRVESLGYDRFLIADHFYQDLLAPARL